ncbi:unnamed protein product [Aureobasidium pullulans]|uniref:Zn(2)-C6 fungal-type domain-containing protein n=1 Tax=Aureobasidium pullulans TaxID=5580 RepID=A0A4S8XSU9_AURPU|nr:hypothetical protein D6D22_05104 [Aureobasidium pullulans]CAC9890749.1 unnamed protein product [Aureobasidium pullulans]
MTTNGRVGHLQSSKSPTSKRRKIAIACEPCRKRKVRCDGKQPTCSPCMTSRKTYTCIYESSPQATQQRYIEELQNRITDLGGHVNVQASQDASSESMQQPDSGQSGIFTATASAHLGPITDASSPDVVFGESSTATFLQQLSHEAGQKDRPPLFAPNESDSCPLRLDRSTEQSAELPIRRIADDLINCYWQYMHPLFPILHEPTFTAAYKKSWTSDQPIPHATPKPTSDNPGEIKEALFFSTLNIIFALGTRFCSSIPSTEKEITSKRFYRRARLNFPYDLLDFSSLPVLQMVLLQGVYLQSTTEVSRCWNVIGVAVRMAQSLGLHAEGTQDRKKTELEREMGRRLWWCCIVLDRLAAATFGWPMMVQDECTIPLPMLSDNALNLEEGNTSSGVDTSSDLCVFRSTCDLFGILGEILSTIYQNNGALLRTTAAQNQASQTLSHIMGLNGRLDAYLISTPPYIRSFIEETEPPTANTVSDTILIHQQAISCRYRYCHRRFLYTKILLLRPALILHVEDPDMSQETYTSPNPHILTHAINVCARACSRVIEILHHNLSSPLRMPDWHIVYITFTAATSLLAIFKSRSNSSFPPINVKVDINQSLRHCYRILGTLEQSIAVSSQAVRSLQNLELTTTMEKEITTRSTHEMLIVPRDMEQGEDLSQGLEGLEEFDWWVNPSAWLSRQVDGLEGEGFGDGGWII